MAEIRPVGRLEQNIALAIVQADEDVGVARNDILHDLQPPRLRVVSVVEDRLQGGAELSEIVNVALFKVGLHRMDHDPGEGKESNDGGEANKEGQPGGQGKGALSGHPAPQAYSRRRARSGSASARSRYQFWRAAASPPRQWR